MCSLAACVGCLEEEVGFVWKAEWREGFQPRPQGHAVGSPGPSPDRKRFTYFLQPASQAAAKPQQRRTRPFAQFLAEFKTDPAFITPSLPPSIHPFISAHRPLTTHMCEERVRNPPSALPSPARSPRRSSQELFQLFAPLGLVHPETR